MEEGLSKSDTMKKIKTCGYFYFTKRQRYILCGIVLFPLVFLVFLIIGLMINAATVKEKFQRMILDPNPTLINANQSIIWLRARRLGEAIRYKTISYNETWQKTEELVNINDFIRKTFPGIHSAPFIEKKIINNLSIVFRVKGTQLREKPYMLCAHLDVVPEGQLSGWDCDPFLGQIVRDRECDPVIDDIDEEHAYIFGRGAIDDKHSVFGILEALEYMINSGEKPKRTFYIAFGHDEEVSGNRGAANIKEYVSESLEQNGEDLAFILDEGNSVYKDVVPGVDIPVAMIGVTEKGIPFNIRLPPF